MRNNDNLSIHPCTIFLKKDKNKSGAQFQSYFDRMFYFKKRM